jgi:hypothetical protein
VDSDRVPKYHLKNARVLIDKFEARLRTQGRQRDGKVQGKLPALRAARQAVVEASTARRKRSKRECVVDLGRMCIAGDWEG